MSFGDLMANMIAQSMPGRGFLWASNNPYLKPLWVTVRRGPKGVAGALTGAMLGPDANGASIIYECMADTDWGMGSPDSLMDASSFEACAATLAAENFGLSLTWSNESEIESFIDVIRDHIDAELFVHPRTGLHTLKLVRNDYDPETLREINPDNARMVSFQRRGWGETTNEMKVTWTNPVNEKEETVSLQDLGNIAQQGSVVSASKNYFGVRNRDLAMWLCARELRKASTPTATCEMQVLREFWDLVPADVVKVTWPEYRMEGVIMRVAEVDYGAPGDAWITLKMSEDVFSLAQAKYAEPPGGEWVDPSQDPTATEFAEVMTLPAYVASGLGNVSVSDFQYPEVLAGVLAATENEDASGFDLQEQRVTPAGDLEWESAGTRSYLGRILLPTALAAEPETLVAELPQPSSGFGPLASMLLVIGSGPLAEREIALIHSVDETGYLLKRGVLDTVPKPWAQDEVAWCLYPGANILDRTPNSDGEVVEFKLLMNTSEGQLELADAPVLQGTMTDRPYLPNRPANVQVEGQGFGLVQLAGLTEASVTWANRNRVTEEQVVLSWTDGDVTPESGQTTTVRALDGAGTTLAEYTGLTGTSYNLPTADFGTATEGFVEVAAERDGFESLQAFRVAVVLAPENARVLEDGTTYRLTDSGDFRVTESELAYGLGLVNGDAETGDMTGWTVTQGTVEANNAYPAFQGTYYFMGPSTAEFRAGQELTVPADAQAHVDAGELAARVSWALGSYNGSDSGEIELDFLDELGASLGTAASGLEIGPETPDWTQKDFQVAVPAGTRSVVLTMHGVRNNGSNLDAYFDAITAGLVFL